MIRLLLPDAAAGTVTATGPRAHHLRVLRVRPGDRLEVFDGRGTCFEARVAAVAGDGVTLELEPGRAAPPPRSITVVQGLPKAEKLELVLQKCTELGATAFVTAAAVRSVTKLDGAAAEKKLARWRRIVEEAARQCHRADVPPLHHAASLAKAVEALTTGTATLVLDEEEHALPLHLAVAQLAPSTALALVIGPEGGLAREEVAALARLGAVSVTLGALVLRTETAALAALAVLRHLDGALG